MTSIGKSAFSSNQLTSLTIPNTVTSIDDGAFSSNQLTSLVIPISLTSIGINVFSNNQLTELTLPDGMTSIGKGLFSNNKLTSITIPNSVTSIGNYTFSNNQLTSVSIPNSVTSIGEYVFRENQLTSVIIPNSVISIGNGAFSENQLTSITIPNGVTSIGERTFYKNELTSITIPNSVTSIGNYAFYDNNLTSLSIPNSVTSIGESAFASNQLTSLAIPNSVTSIGKNAFNHNQLTSITIPNSVVSIGDGAFRSNLLTSVTFPNSVTYIGSQAFYVNSINSFYLPIHPLYDNLGWKDDYSKTFTGGDLVNDLMRAYRIPVHTIHYHLNGGENSENNPSVYFEDDGVDSFDDPTKNGYNFNNWYDNEEFTGLFITKIAAGSKEEKDLWAKFIPIQYNITYHVNYGDNAAENPTKYTIESEKISLAAASKYGYAFEGWYANEEFTGEAIAEIATGSYGEKNLWAKYSLIEYTITYHVNNGENSAENPENYTIESDHIYLAAASKEGYTFEGWYANAEYAGKVHTIGTGSYGEKNLWAKFTPIQYNITYHINQGEMPAGNPTYYYIESENKVLNPASKEGYTFEGWYANEEFSGGAITEIATGSHGEMSLWAKFTPIEYAISYHVDEGGNPAENPATYTLESEKISLAAASKEGYSFMGWFANAEFTGEAITEIAKGSKGNMSLWAKYTPIEYAITYHVDEGENPAENPANYTIESDKISLAPATISKDDYEFKGWYDNAELTGEAITEIATGSNGNMSLWAKFGPLEYAITYYVDEGENSAENPATYTLESEKISLAAASKEGYSFEGWYANAELTGEAITEIAAGSKGEISLWAKYTPIEYVITYHLNEGENAAENPANYTIISDKISLAAASKEAYTFAGWYANEEFTGETITEIVAGSKGEISLWAKYTPIEYTITYHLNEGENAAENPATYTIESDKIVLAAPSKENSNFEGWYANNEFTGKSITEIATGSKGDRELWANWEKITGVKEFVKSNYKFYPNPVVDVLTIESKELTEAIIYDSNGTIVKRFKLKSNKHQEKIGELKSGVYYLKLGDKILKLIKK